MPGILRGTPKPEAGAYRHPTHRPQTSARGCPSNPGGPRRSHEWNLARATCLVRGRCDIPQVINPVESVDAVQRMQECGEVRSPTRLRWSLMRVLIQLRPSPDLVAAVADPGQSASTADVADGLPGVVLDASFIPLAVPRPVPHGGCDPLSLNQPLTYSMAADEASVLVRGEIADDELSTRIALLSTLRPDVVGVFADPVISSSLTCGGDPPVGDWHDIERLMGVSALGAAGLDGQGVALAVMDTGINAAFVAKALGRAVGLDAARSWNPSGVSGTAGAFEVDHGSMCAFDALISAPNATLLDLPLLLSSRPGGSAMDGLLSDAVAGY